MTDHERNEICDLLDILSDHVFHLLRVYACSPAQRDWAEQAKAEFDSRVLRLQLQVEGPL